MDYLNFDLEIGEGAGREYPVVVLRSPAGEARGTMRFPYDELRLDSALKDVQIALLRSGGKHRSALSQEQQSVRDFGRALFDAVIAGEVRSRYDVSLERAHQAGQGLRLRLRFQSPALAALPWEFLYDDREAEYVCLTVSTPLVRYLELPRPPQALVVAPPLRILGVACSPKGLQTLDVENEKRRVEEALKGLQDRGLVELCWLSAPTWRALQGEMRRGPWHVFHFVGHGGFDAGADEGLIYLADEDGKALSLRATELGRLLADHPPLRLAVLNSCEGARGSERDIFSSTASILVRRGLPAVVAMQYEITDRAAVELSRSFYEALADNLPVDAAVAEARKAVSLEVANTVEWGTPVLYMRSPDGVLFRVEARPSAAAAAPTVERKAAAQEEQRPAPAVVTQQPTVRAVDPQPDLLVIDTPIRLELICIPAGEFLMGDNKDLVDVAEFYIGKYPITNAQYAAFVQAKNYNGPDHWKEGRIPAGKESHPVVNVSWLDSVAFCDWLSQATSRQFRLPTEAEWEKAARGGQRIPGPGGALMDNPLPGRQYPWGDKFDKTKCNMDESGIGDTTPVGKYSPAGDSPYGVADLSGNVWEWCLNEYDNPERIQLEGDAMRVVRGGSWGDLGNVAAAPFRGSSHPGDRFVNYGFRVVVVGWRPNA